MSFYKKKFKKPKFWNNNKPNFLAKLLLPFTLILMINNFILNLKKKFKLSQIKSICVGNIYLGGSGKTPLTIKLYNILNSMNIKTVTAKKDYKDQLDEQIILKKKAKLILATDRLLALKKAVEDSNDVIIFDDGLQDNKIDYDLKFVCFKVKNWIGNGYLLPAGPLREKINSLKKYDAVFLNGNNENLDEIKSKIEEQNKNIKIFESNYKLLNLDNFNKKDRYLAFAGIGIPSNFHTTLINNGIKIVKFLEYPDHWKYDYKELEKIINIAKSMNAKIITTEKDYVRLENHNTLQKKNIKFIKMELKVKNENELISYLKTNI